MLVVRVELHSAVTGAVTELARMDIVNTGGGTAQRGEYITQVFRGRDRAALNKRKVQREGRVNNWPRLQLHVWNLVAVALRNMGYGEGK